MNEAVLETCTGGCAWTYRMGICKAPCWESYRTTLGWFGSSWRAPLSGCGPTNLSAVGASEHEFYTDT